MLPLVLEPTWHYLLMAVPLGAPLVGLAAHLAWREWRKGWANFGPGQWFAVALMTGIGTALLIQPLGWQLRCDRDGIALSAPFDLSTTSEEIRWSDLKDLRIGSTGGRANKPMLRFVGKGGATIDLKVLDGVPAGYWPALAAAIEANAPEV